MAFRKLNPITEHSSFVQGTTFLKENKTKLAKVLKSQKMAKQQSPVKVLNHSVRSLIRSGPGFPVLDEPKDKGAERLP